MGLIATILDKVRAGSITHISIPILSYLTTSEQIHPHLWWDPQPTALYYALSQKSHLKIHDIPQFKLF